MKASEVERLGQLHNKPEFVGLIPTCYTFLRAPAASVSN